MHYKPSDDRDSKVSHQKAVMQHDDEMIKENGKVQVEPSDIYVGYHKQILTILTEFQTIWAGNLRHENIAKDCIELTFKKPKLTHNTSTGRGREPESLE